MSISGGDKATRRTAVRSADKSSEDKRNDSRLRPEQSRQRSVQLDWGTTWQHWWYSAICSHHVNKLKTVNSKLDYNAFAPSGEFWIIHRYNDYTTLKTAFYIGLSIRSGVTKFIIRFMQKVTKELIVALRFLWPVLCSSIGT